LLGTPFTSDLFIHSRPGGLNEHVLIAGLPNLTAKVISTPQFSDRALPRETRHERIMKWRACAAPATPYHGPLQLLVGPLARVCHRILGLSLQTVNVSAEANVHQAKYGYSKTAARTLMR
jgi:hypothetical protein